MQQETLAKRAQSRMGFQSSSGQKAGCNIDDPPSLGSVQSSFNPHPARRPDATASEALLNSTVAMVSILIRPEGRMQRICFCHLADIPGFQSSSSQKAGCNRPFPSYQESAISVLVSILIQPEGRMQPRESPNPWKCPPIRQVFQSSSSQKAGCNYGTG